MFGIIKKILSLIFGPKKKDKTQKEFIVSYKPSTIQFTFLNAEEIRRKSFNQRFRIFLENLFSRKDQEDRNFSPLKIRKKIKFWRIKTKLTLESIQEISEMKEKRQKTLIQKFRSFFVDFFSDDPVFGDKKLISHHEIFKDHIKDLNKEILTLKFKNNPNENEEIINEFLFKQSKKEKNQYLKSEKYKKLNKIDRMIEYEEQGRFIDFEERKREEFREKHDKVFEVLTGGSNVLKDKISQKRFFYLVSHSFIQISQNLPEILERIKKLEIKQAQRETKMHERILLGGRINENDDGLRFYKDSLLDIHDRFDEIEERLKSFEQKYNIKSIKFKKNFGELDEIGFKKALEILTERAVGFERWMKFHSSKLKKLEKECGIHNEAFSTLINHIQKECEIQFNFVEDNFYNLQSCVIFGLKDANKELEKLMNISLRTRDNLDSVLDNENFQMVLNNNIFIKLGAKINSGFEKIRGFFRIFHNSEGLVLESSDGSDERSHNLKKIPRKISKGITKFEKNSDRFTEVLKDSVELVASKIIFEKAFNFFQSKILRIPRFCFVIVKRKLRNIFRN